MRLILAFILLLSGVPHDAWGADSASLQITVPAPDPVVAGEAVTFQVLAVNTGTDTWLKGTYYWGAEVYDLEYRYIARSDAVTPQENIPPGAVASAFLKFQVPETYLGRRFYRVFLVRNGRRLIESDFQTFLIAERPVQPPPPIEKFKLGGNITLAYKNSDEKNWEDHSGATTMNLVGKVEDSSFLFNAYLLHRPKLIDPYILLFNYYAPWGTISLGDVSPTLSPLSVSGQGMRGAMLDQVKGRYHWTVLGGETVRASAGTVTTDGRYQRLLFGAQGGAEFFDSLKVSADYVLGTDEPGSLSKDPKSPNFRGPTLTPQKAPLTGTQLSWNPVESLLFSGDFQKSTFFRDSGSSQPGINDSAWRGELRWERPLFKIKGWVQRAGPNFVSFGAPSVISDRMTFDGNLGLYPFKWWSVTTSLNQYRDNLKDDPSKVTTAQKLMAAGNSFVFPTGTTLNVSYLVNTAQGKPQTAQDNQTTTLAANAAQSLRSQNINLGYQLSRFTDKNKLAHDLDSQTISFNTTWSLFQRLSTALGTTQSTAKDLVDFSQRKNQTYSASFGFGVIPKRLTLQLWGTTTLTKNDSPTFPSDLNTMTLNMEWTYQRNSKSSVTLGGGHNQVRDKIQPANDTKELTATVRYSYSF